MEAVKPPKTVEPPAQDQPEPPHFMEIDPASQDMTVEMSREFLAEHSSEILGLVDGTDEAFQPRKVMGDLWTQFQEEIPTAKVKYLGEPGPESYDLEDLVDPPTPQAIENILTRGAENPDEELSEEEGFFVDLGALEQLSDWSVAAVEQPTSEALASPKNPRDRMRAVNQIVAKSRELASDPAPPLPVGPPPAPLEAPAARFDPTPTQEIEEWQLEGDSDLIDLPPTHLRREPSWAPRIAGLGLAVMAGWAYATAVAMPVVAALVVGALALLLLGGRGE